MSNFWAQKLGVPAAPAAPQAPVARPWYDTNPYQPPVPQQVHQQAPAAPEPQPEQHGWGSVEKSMQRAQSARSKEVCPACGSGNFFRPSPNVMAQCNDCGENPRFSQTGGQGGLPSGSTGAAGATPARQIEGAGLGGASQYRPDVIVGRA